MPDPIRLIIDTDIGVDDAVAIVLALRCPGVRVEAITTVSGNVDVDQCVRNARYVMELCGCELPVYRGADQPLTGPPRRSAPVHGSGLGDRAFRPSSSAPDSGKAADRLVQLGREGISGLTLVTLGPLTNLAQALRLAPDLASAFQRVVIMAGSRGPGTVTPRAEFNVWCDPVAAREVLTAGLPIVLVPIDVSRGRAAHSRADLVQISAIGTPLAEFVYAMCCAATKSRRGSAVAAGLPDAIAMAIALNSALVRKSRHCYVDVETVGELTSGETVIDSHELTGHRPNVELVEQIDFMAYKKMVREACRWSPPGVSPDSPG